MRSGKKKHIHHFWIHVSNSLTRKSGNLYTHLHKQRVYVHISFKRFGGEHPLPRSLFLGGTGWRSLIFNCATSRPETQTSSPNNKKRVFSSRNQSSYRTNAKESSKQPQLLPRCLFTLPDKLKKHAFEEELNWQFVTTSWLEHRHNNINLQRNTINLIRVMQCDLKWYQKWSILHAVLWNYSLFTYCQLIRNDSAYLCIIIVFAVFFSSPFLSFLPLFYADDF